MTPPSLRRGLSAVAALAALTTMATAHSAAADAPAGTVTDQSPAVSAFGVVGAATVDRITYWTRDSSDRPALSSALVFLPQGAPPPGGRPVVAWDHGTMGVAGKCAPSTMGLDDDHYTELFSRWLADGYAVVATDYIGLGTPGPHAYLDGHAEANATVDSVRAARAVEPGLSTRWAVVGHSQGGQAAMFTATDATRYAPELDYRGGAAYAPGASAVDLMTLLGRPGLPKVLPPDMNAYAAYALLGLQAARPDFDLDSYLTPFGRDIVARARQLCLDDLIAETADVNVSDMLARPLDEGDFPVLAHPVMDIPTSGYDRPLLIAQGAVDADVPAPMVWNLEAQLVGQGTRVEMRNYPGDDHETLLATAAPDVDGFLAQLLR
ncbi:lipase family protein [Nocardia sp. NPDC101769]|uniref:lipase family protein n=1 Tax=Nocardia sp. NPDC101769 TaxID=3364333 RepID=UPI0037FC38E7